MSTIPKPPVHKLRGVIAAIPTPVGDTGPDHRRLISLARHMLNSGCHGLNVLGTTGEATSFSVEQRMAVMSAVAQANLPMNRLMVGTGAAAVTDAITLSRHAAALGFAGVLLLPPFYYKHVTDAGIITYIYRIAESTAEAAVPIYLYNFPALSGVAYTQPLVEKLVKQLGTRIAGLKDSSGDLSYAMDMAALSRPFDVFPSSEAHLLSARSGLFAGCISATANISSRDCAKAFDSGDEAALSRAIAVRILFDGLPLIPTVKYLLSEILGDRHLAKVMPPLAAPTPSEANVINTRFSAVIRQSGWVGPTSEGQTRESEAQCRPNKH
jgi:4-hydroxy-tetrahydrodipicolinate synthase